MYITVNFFQIGTLGITKISGLFFFRRIFCVVSRTIFGALTLVTVAIVALWTVTFLVLTALQCGTHFDALWSPAAYKQYCHISYPFLLALTISDLLLDVWILCLPIYPVGCLRNVQEH